MDKRFTLFMILAVVILAANQVVISLFFPAPLPPVKPPAKIAKADSKPDKANSADALKQTGQAEQVKADTNGQEAAGAPDKPAEAAANGPAKEPDAAPAVADERDAPLIEPRWITLGSADPNSPFRLLVYLTNRGAAIERLELNSPSFRDLEDRSGYLGCLPADAPHKEGALVRAVGPGTPAAAAGLQTGDVIAAVDKQRVANATEFVAALSATVTHQAIELTVRRDDTTKMLTATLDRQPLAVIRPEFESKPVDVVVPGNHDPLSFLLTLEQVDERMLGDDAAELDGVDLQSGEWEVVAANQAVVSFRKRLPRLELQVTKTYRLEKVPAEQAGDSDYPAYSLLLDVAIENVGKTAHEVAYRLGGPTGLPIEGAWYANKVSRTWGTAGLRDIITRFEGGATTQVTTATIAADGFKQTWTNSPLNYIAVDAQYFAAAVIPQKPNPTDVWFADVKPIRVGAVPEEKAFVKLTDVSFRLISKAAEVTAGGPPLEHHFQIFAGPKKPGLLAQYPVPGTNITLSELVYYGWFGIVAEPMLFILHAFHSLVGNYGLAIIMLTVLVRGCMFPLSRKQALSAQKMQELQPEIKRLNEKFKDDAEKKTRAQQQLFREHNYNPLGGCLLAFVQLPIFVGLYRSLTVDVELRQAPLFSDSIRWASNLAAPDMLWNWTGVVPEFISHGTGFFGLGPYLNILPLVTIGLFIWQQKMFMPPPADDQAAMQQKMMQYMMIFMGVLFFKVASGLCVYFIASSIWGIAERKLLPKKAPAGADAGGGGSTAAVATTSGNGAALKKKRQRGRR